MRDHAAFDSCDVVSEIRCRWRRPNSKSIAAAASVRSESITEKNRRRNGTELRRRYLPLDCTRRLLRVFCLLNCVKSVQKTFARSLRGLYISNEVRELFFRSVVVFCNILCRLTIFVSRIRTELQLIKKSLLATIRHENNILPRREL